MRKTKTMPTADDTAAIQAAIDHANSLGGGKVHLDAKTVTPEPAKAPAKSKPPGENELQLAEFCYRTWCFDLAKLKCADGKPVTLDDFVKPAFWGNHLDKIRVDDRIRVIAADRSFDFELVVVGSQPGVGLLLRRNDSANPDSPTYRALQQIARSVRAQTDVQRAEVRHQYGVTQ